MLTIIITTLVIAVIGIVIGEGLVYTDTRFKVVVDEKETAVRECLPGNNCGACGFAGCDALAGAIANRIDLLGLERDVRAGLPLGAA